MSWHWNRAFGGCPNLPIFTPKQTVLRHQFVIFACSSLLIVVGTWYLLWPPAAGSPLVLLPVILFGCYDMVQHHQTFERNILVMGWGHYIMEALRPKIYQYFIESDTNGNPANRGCRGMVYERAK